MTIIGQHRKEQPYGMNGGHPGKAGQQFLYKSTGEIIELKGSQSIQVQKNDIIHILTPGGGGFGKK